MDNAELQSTQYELILLPVYRVNRYAWCLCCSNSVFVWCIAFSKGPISNVGLTYIVYKGQRTNHFLFLHVFALATMLSVELNPA